MFIFSGASAGPDSLRSVPNGTIIRVPLEHKPLEHNMSPAAPTSPGVPKETLRREELP
jgi:hypothetical protein